MSKTTMHFCAIYQPSPGHTGYSDGLVDADMTRPGWLDEVRQFIANGFGLPADQWRRVTITSLTPLGPAA